MVRMRRLIFGLEVARCFQREGPEVQVFGANGDIFHQPAERFVIDVADVIDCGVSAAEGKRQAIGAGKDGVNGEGAIGVAEKAVALRSYSARVAGLRRLFEVQMLG